jgi:hypothetical protein
MDDREREIEGSLREEGYSEISHYHATLRMLLSAPYATTTKCNKTIFYPINRP